MNEPLEDEYSLGEMMRNGNRRTEQVRPQDVIPLWKKGLFSLVATVLVFALLELILALVGIRPVFYEEDPYVGFSAYSPLFIKEQSGGHTVMTTAPNKLDFFNSQQFAKRKPAGTYRIFCLGGIDYLRTALRRSDIVLRMAARPLAGGRSQQEVGSDQLRRRQLRQLPGGEADGGVDRLPSRPLYCLLGPQ